ncbi:Fungal specific transcription factor domain-containing protein [Cladophialophora immunda]|nr:Fungal specific transcription factor domain-containing protein [Cladophialophora immunda]
MSPDFSLCSADKGAIRSTIPTVPSSIHYIFQPPSQPMEPLPETITLSRGIASPTAPPFPALPAYINPLPSRFGHDDIIYLQNKGALSIPDEELRNELLRNYAEYMHPFMPLLDVHKFVRIITQNDGSQSVSLLLFQAVMFAGVATVDMRLLRSAGYSTRREARRALFEKTRLLYDLDYEDDSIALIQALLLMTYWRESRTGRKETHYWIEVAVSLAHKIGLHRNPEGSTTLEPWRQKLYKRIWWSAVIRDAQISLGTQKSTRMTRIKDVDFDVPMLQLADFELDTLPNGPCCVPTNCEVLRDVEKQRQLAVMCIEMAKLSLCISHILSVQHGLTSSKASAWTATMLFPESLDPSDDQMQDSAKALQEWKERLPEEAQKSTPSLLDVESNNSSLVVNRAFLHLLYYAALSALHRSPLQPSTGLLPPAARSNVVDLSRETVRHAAIKIAEIAGTLHDLDLVRYLPSPSITVLLHAIVSHLLDVLAPKESTRLTSLQDFCKCMQIMAGLRDMYPAADYSTAFLQTAIQRTDIGPMMPQTDEDRETRTGPACAQRLPSNELRLHPADPSPASQLASPPAEQVLDLASQQLINGTSAPDALGSDNSMDRRLYSSLASATHSYNQHDTHRQHVNHISNCSQHLVFDAMDTANDPSAIDLNTSDNARLIDGVDVFELGFDGMTNLGAAGQIFHIEEDAFGAMPGENGGFSLDPDPFTEMHVERLTLP